MFSIYTTLEGTQRLLRSSLGRSHARALRDYGPSGVTHWRQKCITTAKLNYQSF